MEEVSKEVYTVYNFIKTMQTFKPFINCQEDIYLHIKIPVNIDAFLFNPHRLAYYSLSPCEIIFKGEAPVEKKKGFFIINKLHPEYIVYKVKENLLFDANELLLFKVDFQ